MAKFIKKGDVQFGPSTAKEIPKTKQELKDVKKGDIEELKKEYMKFEEIDKEGCDRIFEYYGMDEVNLSIHS